VYTNLFAVSGTALATASAANRCKSQGADETAQTATIRSDANRQTDRQLDRQRGTEKQQHQQIKRK